MKRSLSLNHLFQAIIGLTAVLVLTAFAITAHFVHERRQVATKAREIVSISRDLYQAMQTLRVERGTMNTALLTDGPIDPATRAEISALRAKADPALDTALAKLTKAGVSPRNAGMIDILRRRATFIAMREVADRATLSPRGKRPANLAAEWVAADGGLVNSLAGMADGLTEQVALREPFVARMMQVKQLAWSLRATAGTDRLRLAEGLAKGERLSPAQVIAFAERRGGIETDLVNLRQYGRLSSTPRAVKAAIAHVDVLYANELQGDRSTLIATLARGEKPPLSGAQWIRRSNPGLASIGAIATTAFDEADAYAAQQARAADRLYTMAAAIMLISLALALITAAILVRRFVRPMAEITAAMRRLARGDLCAEAPFLDRGDEMGELGRALQVFRDNALAADRMHGELIRSGVEREAAEAANHMKSQFLANMSHEIRTPLNGVLGMVQVMQMDDATPVQTDRLNTIRESGEALLQILNDLLDFSRIEAGKLELIEGEFDVEDLARRATAVFADNAAVKGVKLSWHVAPETRGAWIGDATRIRQMLLNLLSNAVKFTSAGEVSLRVEAANGALVFTIKDSGAGIPADQLPRLFGKFAQLDESNTRQYGGSGLGLAICRELAGLMNGEITADSMVGLGSIFRVSLPLARGTAQPVEAAPAAQPLAPEPSGEAPLRILAAEDNLTNQRVLAALLAPLNIQLTTVENGRQAVEAWAQADWDLILMDIQMPEMGGVDAARFIRTGEIESGRAPAPIIALTANAMSHQVAEYLDAGMNGHVAKPIRVEALYAAIETALSANAAVEARAA